MTDNETNEDYGIIANEDKLVIVKYKKAYNKEYFYPDNKLSTKLAKFAQCQTLNRDQLKALKRLGYVIKIDFGVDLEGIV